MDTTQPAQTVFTRDNILKLMEGTEDMSVEKKATISLNGYLRSAEVITYLTSQFANHGYSETTFRNDFNSKKIKADKKVSQGKTKVLLFKQATVDEYKRLRAEMYAKVKKGKVKTLKSPDMVSFSVPIYKDRLGMLLSVFTEEQLQSKLRGVLDDAFTKIKTKLDEVEQRKQDLLNEIKSSITL